MVFSTDQRAQVPAGTTLKPWNTSQNMSALANQHPNHGPKHQGIPDPQSWRFIFGAWRGRVSRRTFWLYGVGALLGLGLLGHALLAIAGVDDDHAELIVDVLLIYPALAVSAKRWQDRNRSPAWVLVVLIPVVGWAWALFDNGLVRGTAGANRFGPPPTTQLSAVQ